MDFIRKLPLFVVLMAMSSLAMFVPMSFAVHLRDWEIARTFFYHGTFLFIFTSLIAIATSGRRSRNQERHHLLTIVSAFTVLPLVLALPFEHLVPSASLFHAWFEMLSCLTTTGATLFTDPAILPAPLHLWRSLVGWLGGYMMLVVAIAIFAPLRLGGFEVFGAQGQSNLHDNRIRVADANRRLLRFAFQIGPIYLFLTLALVFFLALAGDRLLVAVTHAMAILSTSGISPVGGLTQGQSGAPGEIIVFVFFLFAVSRHTFLGDNQISRVHNIRDDKELTLALMCMLIIPGLLFLRHWTAAYEINAEQDVPAALESYWGSLFTVLSFLTTTGFESQHWQASRFWSGLETPGLVLMAVAVMGGGIATTAGGVKLLRTYALYKHGLREIQRLVHPNSVAGSGKRARYIRREGALVAWTFLMLFLISIALVMLALSAADLNFLQSLKFAIAALSNTGPLVTVVGDTSTTYGGISDQAKAILAFAMILGRMETLAVIALLNPEYWR